MGPQAEPCKVRPLTFPQHEGPRRLVVQGESLDAAPSLNIMGVSFKVGASVTELLTPIWEKGKRKFWALKRFLCSDAPLKSTLSLFHKVIGGAMLWCVAVFSPEARALETLNRIMFQLVIYMLRKRIP